MVIYEVNIAIQSAENYHISLMGTLTFNYMSYWFFFVQSYPTFFDQRFWLRSNLMRLRKLRAIFTDHALCATDLGTLAWCRYVSRCCGSHIVNIESATTAAYTKVSESFSAILR